MPSTFVSEMIPLIEPAGASLVVLRDDQAGTVTLALQIGHTMNTLKADAAGWRGLSTALGVPPTAEFVPAERSCRVCGRDRRSVKRWAAANLCESCLGKPIIQGRR